MNDKGKQGTILTRRNFFKGGASLAGAMIAHQAIGQVCEGSPTGDQPLGPFFPNPGTPVDPIRENPDPNVPIALANDSDLTHIKGRVGTAQGQLVRVKGQVLDESCEGIANARIIIWQASSTGRYNHNGDSDNTDFTHPKTGKVISRDLDPNFQYWGRTVTNAKGEYEFSTIIPGFYPARLDPNDPSSNWYRPPHIHFMISALGYEQLVTQMYFKGEDILENAWIQELNSKDPLLNSARISQKDRERLVVEFKKDSGRLPSALMVGEFPITLTR